MRKPRKKAPPRTGPDVRVSTVPVPAEVATAVEALGAVLERRYGPGRYAFAVRGDGGLIASDSAEDGIVRPLVAPDPPEGRVYDPADLAALPVGAVIAHPVLGRGTVVAHPSRSGETAAFFKGGGAFDFTAGPHSPWAEPVRVTVRPSE